MSVDCRRFMGQEPLSLKKHKHGLSSLRQNKLVAEDSPSLFFCWMSRKSLKPLKGKKIGL
ncbi:hypothetical protein AAC387_Pa07g1465 [Persea americana]